MRAMSEILSDALASFEGGKRWAQGALFKSNAGLSYSEPGKMDEGAEVAEKFCAYGAIYRSMKNHGEITSIDDINQRRNVCGWVEKVVGNGVGLRGVVNRNDMARDFSDVKEMFCSGIQRALKIEESDDQ